MKKEDTEALPEKLMSFLDKNWTQDGWRTLVESLVNKGLVSWKEVASVVLGELNPPQVGTQVASNKEVQAFFEKRKTWVAVREWLYRQKGTCVNCGARLGLQADHIQSRAEGGSYALSNYQLLCRRCNVIKRPSHKKGGLTYLSAESALMWILFVCKPKTYADYMRLCRQYGLTMANIRFEEAWAMAEWLKKEGKYP